MDESSNLEVPCCSVDPLFQLSQQLHQCCYWLLVKMPLHFYFSSSLTEVFDCSFEADRGPFAVVYLSGLSGPKLLSESYVRGSPFAVRVANFSASWIPGFAFSGIQGVV